MCCFSPLVPAAGVTLDAGMLSGIVLAALIIEALLVVWLWVAYRRRRGAEHDRERFAGLVEIEHRHLTDIINIVPGITWETLIDPDTGSSKTTFISDYVEKMLGYTSEEWLSSPPGLGYRLMPEEDRDRARHDSETVIRNGEVATTQHRWQAKDGRLLWIESYLSPIMDATGKIVGLRGVSFDITDKKLAADAQRQSEERNRAILQAVPDLMFLQTRDGTYLDYQAADLKDLFLPPVEFLGRNMRDVLPPELAERFANGFERAAQTGRTQVVEYQLMLLERERWFEARIVRSGDNILSVIRDVTERKQAEDILQQMLEEVNRLKNQLQAENIYLREEIKLEHNFSEIVGHGDAIKYVLHKIEQVAPTNSTVLIMGETGTGKELVARAIHSQSLLRERPLVKVNCAALSATLIESELFGHEKGAFTGAAVRKIGRFELADKATIFLDEIGELPLALQGKLLRVIQEGEFERLGSTRTIKADVRIIAATNRNLWGEVQKGLFREDLWYRLNVFPITMPPLRQRVEDVPLLVEHFVHQFSKKMGKKISSVSPATLSALCQYS
ncbi:MAG: sigma 54-interacting transcriptional regulator, partial [Acidobacteria bacterium]|nr:sigma 54-interacting transcriptional regulator [Acidobacteriota bacterium]